MELHSIKEKESKSKPTGDSSLKLAKDVISAESIKKKKGLWQVEESFVHATCLLRH